MGAGGAAGTFMFGVLSDYTPLRALIALELGLRFMTDYLRGDNYFKLSPADPPELNKVRGMAQLTLFERLRKRSHETKNCIRDLISHL